MRLDRTGKRSIWQAARTSEIVYNSKLVQVAKQVGLIVTGLAPDGEVSQVAEREIRYSLARYADLLRPWARSVARYMIADVNRRNERAWFEVGKEMGRALSAELRTAPTGMLFDALQHEQVELITSLPTKAAQRVHDLTTKALIESTRADTIAAQILATGQVTASRATLIARTEVARTASNLTQARSMYAGSEGYIWRTSKDADVRETHKKEEGRYIRWDKPPQTDKGLDPYHAGCGPNCRCYCEPIIPHYNDQDDE